jgi:diguanylate cyclase (GGDEF)-like protein/PAS domain S-box-containing protein
MRIVAPFSAWSLKTKFALAGGALMLVFSLAFSAWTLRLVETEVRQSVTDAQRALVHATAGDIDEKIELRRDAMTTIAALLSQAAPAPGAGMEAFFKPRPVLEKMFDAVLVADASGRIVYDQPRRAADASTGASVAGRDYFKQVMGGAPLVVSPPQKAPAGGEPFVVFAAPLRARDGSVNGALICSLDLIHGNFLGNLGRVRIGDTGYFVLVNDGEKPVFVMHGRKELVMTPLPDGRNGPIMRRALQGFDGNVEGPDLLGVPTLRSFIRLRSVPWVLVADYPTSEAYAGLRSRQREVLLVAGGLFAAASLLVWLMAGWLLRPLARLRAQMDMHAFDPGLPMPQGGFGSAELAALVVAYNAQAASRREFEERLKASERRMRDITDNLPVMIAYVDKEERYVFLNATFKTWLGLDPATAPGSRLADVIDPAVYEPRRDAIRRCLAGARVTFDMEADTLAGRKMLHIDYIPDIGPDGAVAGFYALSTDVTELSDAQRRLSLLVRLDALTGLPNRYQFNETLPLAFARCARSGLPLALMFLDIDLFKQVNDRLGHGVGDLLLKEFAQRLRGCVRATDMVARFGGDEFVVILEGLHDDLEPQFVARKIIAEMNRPFDLDGHSLAATASVGIAFHSGPVADAEGLLARADAALYGAKAAGRNAYRVSQDSGVKPAPVDAG